MRRKLQLDTEVDAAGRHSREITPEFAAILDAVHGSAADAARPRSARDWAELFAELLRTAGWPGSGRWTAAPTRLLQPGELLADFATSADVLGPLTLPRSLAALQQLAAQRLFQPEGRQGGVQVIGALEAAGHEFDALWLCGMAGELWPPSVRPSPYLPLPLQRRLSMPDSSPAVALALARERTERLLRAAPEVCVSWPTELDGEPTLGLTPLVSGGAHCHLSPPSPVAGWNRTVLAAAPAEMLEPDPPPPWPVGRVARGGAALLTRQATSPADAFIEHRLGGRLLEPPAFGITPPRQKGELTHLASRCCTARPPRSTGCVL